MTWKFWVGQVLVFGGGYTVGWFNCWRTHSDGSIAPGTMEP